MLGIISKSAPYKPSAGLLVQKINVSKNNVSDYLLGLERTGMIGIYETIPKECHLQPYLAL